MALEMRLEVKLQQKLVMTLMLQQAIKLLPLTRLELVQRINQELLENPLLEDIEAMEDEAVSSKEAEEQEAEESTGEDIESIDWEDYIQENFDNSFSEQDLSDGYSLENTLRDEVSINDYLFSQLMVVTNDENYRRIGAFLIGNIDESGYLKCQTEETVSILEAEPELVEKVVALIQTLDPPGVGARDLRESLLIQLRAMEDRNPLAEELVDFHLDKLELKNRNFSRLARQLKVPLEALLDAFALVEDMDPSPGSRFNPEKIEYITPDVKVVKVNDEYQILLDEEGIPRLRINSFYRKLLKQRNNADKKAKEFLSEKLQSAVWLIKSIEQRRQTLYKVARSIVDFQTDFLDNGISGLKPLVLRDVADVIEMHESTVSRVVTNKYIDTPQGLYELKFFFHSGVNSTDGSTLSSVVVKGMLRKMVEEETREKPFTDQDIVDRFRKQDVSIARRTVAKYRKELKIPSSGSRKRMFSMQTVRGNGPNRDGAGVRS